MFRFFQWNCGYILNHTGATSVVTKKDKSKEHQARARSPHAFRWFWFIQIVEIKYSNSWSRLFLKIIPHKRVKPLQGYKTFIQILEIKSRNSLSPSLFVVIPPQYGAQRGEVGVGSMHFSLWGETFNFH